MGRVMVDESFKRICSVVCAKMLLEPSCCRISHIVASLTRSYKNIHVFLPCIASLSDLHVISIIFPKMLRACKFFVI